MYIFNNTDAIEVHSLNGTEPFYRNTRFFNNINLINSTFSNFTLPCLSNPNNISINTWLFAFLFISAIVCTIFIPICVIKNSKKNFIYSKSRSHPFDI